MIRLHSGKGLSLLISDDPQELLSVATTLGCKLCRSGFKFCVLTKSQEAEARNMGIKDATTEEARAIGGS